MTIYSEAFKHAYGLIDPYIKLRAERAIEQLVQDAERIGDRPIDLQRAVEQLKWDDMVRNRRVQRGVIA